MARVKSKSANSCRLETSALFKAMVFLSLMFTGISAFAQSGDNAPPPESGGFFDFFSEGYGIAILLVLGLVGLIVFKKMKGRRNDSDEFVEEAETPMTRRTQGKDFSSNKTAPAHQEAGATATHWEAPSPATHELGSVFGAYRVDQEVWKLVLGKPHRTDVLASRAPEDRRAIESSMIKALTSPEADENGQQRARQALEEYGFLARQSAILLLGRDAWERTSAARMLGQIGSAAALPFLIEALHDSDVVVRNQAVSSLGELKLPAAIGALLDVARRHPEIPAPLVSEALSACSVDTTAFLDFPSSEPGFTSEYSQTEQHEATSPSFATYTDLPEADEDPAFADLLEQVSSGEGPVRTQAAQQLGTYPVQQSVATLSAMAMSDVDDGARSAAVSSLGSIDHESVFGPILIALAADSREVRAAAARALNSVHFDRGDGYVRIMENSDAEMLRNVAQACVKIGIAAQAVDRLVSEDRRQAYEAFSLFSLLAKANETDPILDVIENHSDDDVRLCAVRVLNVAGEPAIAPRVRELIAGDNISEAIRTSALEVLYRLDQEAAARGIATGDNVTSEVA